MRNIYSVISILGRYFSSLLFITIIISLIAILIDTVSILIILGYLAEAFGFETNISERLSIYLGKEFFSNHLILLFIFSIRALAAVLSAYFNAKAYSAAVEISRSNALRLLIDSNYKNFTSEGNAKYIQTLTTLPLQYGSLIRGIIDILTNIVLLVFLFIILLIDFGLTILGLFLLLSVIFIPLILLMKKILLNAGKSAMDEESKYISYINFVISSFRFIKSSKNQESIISKVSNTLKLWSRNFVKSLFIASIPKVIIETAFIIFSIILIAVSPNSIIFISNHLPVIVIIFFRAIPALSVISGSLQNLQFHWEPSLKLVQFQEQWKDDSDQFDTCHNYSLDNFKLNRSLKIKDPTFNFNNFNFSKGSKKIIYGPSGSGKSIFLDCLSGFKEIESGTISISNKDIIINRDYIRWNGLVYCAQDEKLFEDTVENNIFFRADKSNKELIDNLLLFINKDVKKLYDQIITSNTRFLSGGQKQIIILSRALAQNPKILFLDETTVGLDIELEAKVLNKISTSLPNLTLIMISHRKNKLLNEFELINIENIKN